MRKAADFKSFEFPGVDKDKFEAWQRSEVSLRRYSIIFLILYGLFVVISLKLTDTIARPGILFLLPLIILHIITYSRKRSAGITNEMIKKAQSRP